MVGSQSTSDISFTGIFASSAFAAWFAKICTVPLDTAKVRLQLQKKTASGDGCQNTGVCWDALQVPKLVLMLLSQRAECQISTGPEAQQVTGPATPSQVKYHKASEEPFQTATLSRRDAMISLTTSLASSLVYIPSAEARTSKADIRQKFLEKLKMHLEKAGLGNDKEPVPHPAEKKSQSSNQIAQKIEEPKEKADLPKENTPSSNQITKTIEEIKEKVGLSKEKSPPLNQNSETNKEPKENGGLAVENSPNLSPLNPIDWKIEELQEKIGLSKDGQSLSSVETKLEASEEKLSPVEQIKEKVEMLKSKMGLAAGEESIRNKKETKPHSTLEKPQPANTIMQGMQLVKEKMGLSTTK